MRNYRRVFPYPPELDNKRVKQIIIQKLKEYFEENNIENAVLGLSGGLDSSTVAFLASETLGVERLYIYLMPTSITSSESIEDAKIVIENIGLSRENWEIINIEPMVKAVKGTLGISSKKGLGNAMARIRMITLYQKAAEHNAIVLGTGDKSELLLGYFTKYGDGGVDILPIGDIYKTQLRELAEYIGVPGRIIKKPSTPELWPGQKAEDELGVSYDEVDPILYLKFDLGYDEEEIIREINADPNLIKIVMEKHNKNKHKLKTPPIIKVS